MMRLIKFAKQVNVGTCKLIQAFKMLGFSIENKPTSKVSDEALDAFHEYFAISNKSYNEVLTEWLAYHNN